MSELRLPDPMPANDQVALRPWTDADVPAIAAACSDPLIWRLSESIPSPYRDDDARWWLSTHERDRLEGSAFYLALVDAADPDRVLGAMTLHSVNQAHRRGSLGYWLAPDARGHGYATMGARLLINWCFNELGLARLEIVTRRDNHASQHVAERCGFQREGVLASYFLARDGNARYDAIALGLTASPNR